MKPITRPTEPTSDITVIDMLLQSFRRSLLAWGASPATVLTYTTRIARLIVYLKAQGMPTDPVNVRREHVEMHLLNIAETPTRTGQPPAPTTLRTHYNALCAFFKWLVEQDEIPASPMERIKPPRMLVPKKPVLTDEQVRRVLKTCEGKTFADRRDHALIMLLIDTGLRQSELLNLTLDDIDWDEQSIYIRRGKGGKGRTVYFGKRTARVLDQYVFLKGGRRDHSDAPTPWLWLGGRGRLKQHGLWHMLKRRGERAGIPNLHPHLWRHYFIHASLKAGAQVGDLMRITGHSRVEHLMHYAESAADERARESHRKLGPGDRL